MKIKSILIILFAILLVIPRTAFAAEKNPDQLEIAVGKFSQGGMNIIISSPAKAILLVLNITYCDGTGYTKYYRENMFYRNITYYSNKEMEKVQIVTTNPYLSRGGEVQIFTNVQRKCGDENGQEKLYCNGVIISREIHRSQYEAISFKSNRFVHLAGLKFPGVERTIWAENYIFSDAHPHWEYNGIQPNLSYDYSTKIWSGTFPSLRVPIGSYQNVWLVIMDESGNSAKCRVGNVNILP